MRIGTGQLARRRPGRWGWLRTPALAAGLVLLEGRLVATMGAPTAQLRALGDLGLSPTDPVTPLLAVLTLVAQALIGYVVVILALRTLSLLPGSIGGLTGRALLLLSPDAVRRMLDLLIGGTLLAQATLTAMPGAPPGRATDTIHTTMTRSPSSGGSVGIGSRDPATESDPHLADVISGRPRASVDTPSVAGPPMIRTGPVTRPPSRRLAAPLPPWLGGGPSKPRSGHTVEPGDTLWDIAAAELAPTERSPVSVDRYWRRIHRANRPVIGADPDLIHPGTRLDVPPFRSDRP